jgi:hypothetical protein
MVPDSLSGNLLLSTRQKDPSGKSYTSRGFHLALKQNDSVCCLQEDTKLDILLAGDNLILSNDKRSGRFNRVFGYEQFEFLSKIIYVNGKNNSGLTYSTPSTSGNPQQLSCVGLLDGTLLWNASIPGTSDWNDVVQMNDSMLVIAAGGLHGVHIRKGLVWSYPLVTTLRTNKAITYSAFNKTTYERNYRGIKTSDDETQITQISSSILLTEKAIYFASKNKLVALEHSGKLMWEADLSPLPMSRCILYEKSESIVLVNLGVAQYNETTVLSGKPFVKAYNKQTGAVVLNLNDEFSGNLTDVGVFKNTVLVGDKSLVMQVTEDSRMVPLMNLYAPKFGQFLEFINGDEYYIEKEGFYVPLNFINDNVIYFKTDHGKVFGMNKGDIEYEYHFTELYKFNKNVGDKKLISQKNKTLLISGNFELLHSFTTGEPAVVIKDKIYFADGKLLYVINANELK